MLRVFEITSVLGVVLGSAISLLHAQTVVSVQDLQHALASAGLIVRSDQILAMPRISVVGGTPELELVAVSAVSRDVARLTIRCRDFRCVPFVVYVSWCTQSEMHAALGDHFGTSSHAQSDEYSVRPGAHLILRILASHSEMRMRVTALQAGNPGDSIRVRGDKGDVHTGEIEDGITVRELMR